jgi:hypothetical protein
LVPLVLPIDAQRPAGAVENNYRILVTEIVAWEIVQIPVLDMNGLLDECRRAPVGRDDKLLRSDMRLPRFGQDRAEIEGEWPAVDQEHGI